MNHKCDDKLTHIIVESHKSLYYHCSICGKRQGGYTVSWGYGERPSFFSGKILVNPVNCVGVMGAGLAKKFKLMFPENYIFYRKNYRSLKPGKLLIYRGEKTIINFPTKTHWREKSKIEYITTGLAEVEKLETDEFIFIPALGCGLGGLSWDKVRPEILKLKKNLVVFGP